jgi:hypothetical protein
MSHTASHETLGGGVCRAHTNPAVAATGADEIVRAFDRERDLQQVGPMSWISCQSSVLPRRLSMCRYFASLLGRTASPSRWGCAVWFDRRNRRERAHQGRLPEHLRAACSAPNRKGGPDSIVSFAKPLRWFWDAAQNQWPLTGQTRLLWRDGRRLQRALRGPAAGQL